MADQKNTEKAAPKKVAVPDFDAKKDQTVIGTGAGKHLAKGVEYIVAGADAATLIENGHATLKAGK